LGSFGKGRETAEERIGENFKIGSLFRRPLKKEEKWTTIREGLSVRSGGSVKRKSVRIFSKMKEEGGEPGEEAAVRKGVHLS